ncbi:hypothetical protein [Pseudofrankia asymbiotica]|uniref:hypothetical protein n=1 Tax=Pseudofrankia asymbiotica TaxID=1834516 RepID=UPI001304422A|nr:hypothetical protein [Pseudofrankia asymbiotica]
MGTEPDLPDRRSPTSAPPIRQQLVPGRLGVAKGLFTVPDDVNAPLPVNIEDLFYG